MNSTKKIAYNTIIQIIGRVIGLMIMLVTINYVSNNLIIDGSAVKGYGQYYIVFTYISIIGVAADLGLYTLLVREIAGKTRQEVGELIGNALGFRFVLFGITLLIIYFLTYLLPYPEPVKAGIVIGVFCAYGLLFAQIFAALFQANMVTYKIVISETLGRLAIVGLTIYVLSVGKGLLWVIGANLIGTSLIVLVSIIYARYYCAIKMAFNFGFWKKTSPELITIALITLLSLIHFKIDSIILSVYKDSATVGIYGLAYKLLEIIAIIPSIYAANVMPYLSGVYETGNLEKMGQFLRKSLAIISAVAIPIAFIVYLLAPWFVVLVSSNQFSDAVTPLRILVFAVGFAFIAEVTTGAITAAREQRSMIKIYLFAVSANIILNIVFIPVYSYIGAAVITVITEGILMFSLIYLARKKLGKSMDFIDLIKVGVAAVVSFALYLMIKKYTLIDIDSFINQNKATQFVNLGLNSLLVFIIYFSILRLFIPRLRLFKK